MSATSTPPASPSRRDYCYVPNSLVENMIFFTRAELALALTVLRRSNSIGGDPVTVSDSNWREWTGLSPRQKEYAVAGLAKKGLWVEGRGDKAKYSWQYEMFESYARQTAHDQQTKTDGRKANAVPAKKGAMVHADCAEGCAMLQQATGAAAKLVLLPAGKIEQAWPATLATLRGNFPMVTGAFLARLVAIVKASIGVVTDAELAHAVAVAHKDYQRGEGLFLQTVPEALAAIRRVKAKPVPPAAGGISTDAILQRIGDVLAVLSRDTWAPGDLLADLARLKERYIDDAPELRNMQQLDDEMNALEKRIIEAGRNSIGIPQRDKINRRVADKVKPYALKMSPAQLDQLGANFLEHELMEYFGVPRLGAFYA